MKSVSPVRIRSIRPNPNSDKDQVTVQVMQLFEGAVGGNKLVAAAQGASFGPSKVTALFSFKAEKCEEYFGTTEADYSNLPFEEWPTMQAFEAEIGEPVAISVVENTTQDPNRPNQTPKVNPTTGEELTIGGQPIYRHTELVAVSEQKIELLRHDNVTVTAPVEEAQDAFGVTK